MTSTTIQETAKNTLVDVKKYQLHQAYPPDKGSTWKYGVDRTGWMHAHNSLRQELEMLEATLCHVQRSGGIKDWQIPLLQEAVRQHVSHTHDHHSNEEDIVFPILLQRFKQPESVRSYGSYK